MRRLFIVFLLSTFALPASAHKLKVFADVEGESVAGFAFFVGGGRLNGSTFIVQNAQGDELYRGKTNEEGEFSWTPAKPDDMTIIVDAGDGHTGQTTLARDRFPSARSQDIETLVNESVARQVRPLLIAYAENEDRVRFTDVVSGIGMIIGLAGMGLWGLSRRRYHDLDKR